MFLSQYHLNSRQFGLFPQAQELTLFTLTLLTDLHRLFSCINIKCQLDTASWIRTKTTVSIVLKLQIKNHNDILQEVADLEAQLVRFGFSQQLK